jgi:hypothetical protein
MFHREEHCAHRENIATIAFVVAFSSTSATALKPIFYPLTFLNSHENGLKTEHFR